MDINFQRPLAICQLTIYNTVYSYDFYNIQ